MSDAPRPEVVDFFRRYEAVAADGSRSDELLTIFHPTFLAVDPSTVSTVPVERLIATLPAREQLFAAHGVTGMRLESVRESPIDAVHTLADTTWSLQPDGGEVVTSTFLLRLEGGEWRILVYLNHHNIRDVLEECSRLHS
ncbi:hypothetical protein ACQHIV_37935 [Kribbella sp. GL6]|uniref:hypothetical protein n=1 Tax=Kribbella sp. GL6 TaxID=3419765 RepID=UPI003D0942E9